MSFIIQGATAPSVPLTSAAPSVSATAAPLAAAATSAVAQQVFTDTSERSFLGAPPPPPAPTSFRLTNDEWYSAEVGRQVGLLDKFQADMLRIEKGKKEADDKKSESVPAVSLADDIPMVRSIGSSTGKESASETSEPPTITNQIIIPAETVGDIDKWPG